MTKGRILPFLLLCVWILSACGPAAPAVSPDPTPEAVASSSPGLEPSPTPEPTAVPVPPPDPIAQMVARLTTEQKVAQLLVAGIEGLTPGADAEAAVRDYQVGGVILFRRNVDSPEQLAALTNDLKALNGEHIPLFLCVDEEGGRVSRMPDVLVDLPAAHTYGQTGDPALCRRLGQALGACCNAFGLQVDFAPVMDVWLDSGNTVIGDRSYGGDPAQVAELAGQVAAGLADEGVIAAGKHFPGHGDTAVDSHKDLPVVDKSREDWEQADAVPFRAAVEAGVPMIMAGHILLPQIDPDYPASLSPALVDGVLRGEWGFDGVVCTDDLTMGAISNTYGLGEAAVLAVEAGCDLLLVCHGQDNLEAAYDGLLQAVLDGRVSMSRLDGSVYRILSLKLAYGLDNGPVEAPGVEALNQILTAALPE